ncbi:MAG TPA: response regulator [Stellaceae bacterium]|jgi:two-component system KDP operon response regulator KdpE|nr:response regulator [Stellaceae bacterium]
MNKRTTILIVDDEPAIRRFLRTSLAAQDFAIIEADSGATALAAIGREKPDLMILDLGLPDMDGVEVIRRVRAQSDLPIVILSVRDDERGKVEALDLGADDYITKPFGMEELIARARTALRHRFQAHGEQPVFAAGELSVDLVRRIVKLRGNDVRLSPKEYDVLKLLVTHAGKVMTHRQMLTQVWGPAHTEDAQYLRVVIRSLRLKIEPDPTQPQFIQTEAGVGYRLRTFQ